MTIANIERRLAKVEASRRPPRGLFFVAWGRTPAEIEASLGQARAAGILTDSDPVVRCLWSAPSPVPIGRWVNDELGAFSRVEFGALMDEVDHLTDGWVTGLCAEARHDGSAEPEAIRVASPTSDPRTHALQDAALFAAVLAVPLGSTRPALTNDRAWGVLRAIEVLGLRDRIRGRNGIGVPLPAEHPTRH